MAIWLLTVPLILSTLASSNDKKISVDSFVRWMAPDEEQWKEASLPQEVKMFWEVEWSKSIWEESCSDDRLRIVPVYFWPGDRVDFPCALCELAFVFNGKTKRWGVADDVTDFLEKPQKYVVTERGKWRMVQNEEWQNERQSRPPVAEEFSDKLPYSYTAGGEKATLDEKDPPIFLQRDGKLSILRASPANQGVYFCYDENSLGSTGLFYVVMAMVPPVSITDDAAFTDGCTDKEFIIPSFNWRFHFLPAVRYERPAHCEDDPNSCSHLENETFIEVHNTTRPDSDEICDLEHCRVEIENVADNSVKELNVAIELRWDEWTPCTGGVQRREAHCHLLRKNGKEIPDDTSNAVSWMSELNSVFNLKPFNKEGIRLYSSLLPSLIQGVEKLKGCRMEKEGKLETAYREMMLHPMGVRTPEGKKVDRNTEFTFKLRNAFQACLAYERYEDDWELVVGTYMVESRSC